MYELAILWIRWPRGSLSILGCSPHPLYFVLLKKEKDPNKGRIWETRTGGGTLSRSVHKKPILHSFRYIYCKRVLEAEPPAHPSHGTKPLNEVSSLPGLFRINSANRRLGRRSLYPRHRGLWKIPGFYQAGAVEKESSITGVLFRLSPPPLLLYT